MREWSKEELVSILHSLVDASHKSCRGEDNSNLHWPDCPIVEATLATGKTVSVMGDSGDLHVLRSREDLFLYRSLHSGKDRR